MVTKCKKGKYDSKAGVEKYKWFSKIIFASFSHPKIH
jgi:hypothetical protein